MRARLDWECVGFWRLPWAGWVREEGDEGFADGDSLHSLLAERSSRMLTSTDGT